MTNLSMRLAAGAATLALPLTVVAPSAAAPPVDVVPAAAAKGPQARSGLADVSSGPSRWDGRRLRHPAGGHFYPAVLRWASLVSAVLREKEIGQRFTKGVLAQIQQESSGNPHAVNRWDSNAAAGHPSKGLLQVIAPTYREFAKPGFRSLRYQTVPYTNLWAALEYAAEQYGIGKFRSWNHGHNQGY